MSRFRTHLSTKVIFGLGLLAIGIVNCGASVNYFELDDDQYLPWVSFGWPWSYGHLRSETFNRRIGWGGYINSSFNWARFGNQQQGGLGGPPPHIPSFRDYWRIDEIDNVNVKMLIANLLVGLAISGIVAGLWEWRRRYRRSRWQFSLADGMVGMTLFASCFGLWHQRYRGDFVADARIQRALSAAGVADRFQPWHEEEHWQVERNWFWETLHVPLNERPFVRGSLLLINDKSADSQGKVPDEAFIDLPDSVGKSIGQFRNMKTLNLTGVRLSPSAWGDVANATAVSTLSLSGNELGDRETGEFAKLRQLTGLGIEDNPLSDEGLNVFARNKHLNAIWLSNTPNITGNRLSEFRRVTSYRFRSVGINGSALQAMSQMPVCQLTIDDCPAIQFHDWEHLRDHECLQNLTIRNTPFNDESLKAIAKLPRLDVLYLEGTELTDSGMRALWLDHFVENFTLIDNSGRITDESLYFFAERFSTWEFGRYKRSTTIKMKTASFAALSAAVKVGIRIDVEKIVGGGSFRSP